MPPPPVESDRDPGLQPERTRLAWRRTTLAWAVAGVFATRRALLSDGVLPAVVVALVALAFLAFLAVAHPRIVALSGSRVPGLRPRTALAAATCTIVLAAAGVLLLFTPH